MKLTHVETLLALAECGSVRAAAARRRRELHRAREVGFGARVVADVEEDRALVHPRRGEPRVELDGAREVLEGFECGIGVSNFSEIAPGDRVEVFEIQKKARKLE